MYGSGLNEADWHRLKDVVLGAGCGSFDSYDALPSRLKEHPVGVLIAKAKGGTGASAAVREAERMLVPAAPDEASLILMKA